jgi:pilus assembly protein Flp/PilA
MEDTIMDLLTFARLWATARLSAAHGDERGQGAVEYVGIVIVVVAIIAALALVGPDIGEAIGNGLQQIVSNFVGG